MNEERIDDGLANFPAGVRRVHRHEELARALASEESEVADRGDLQLEIRFILRDLVKLVGAAAEKHGLDDLLANLDRSLSAVEFR